MDESDRTRTWMSNIAGWLERHGFAQYVSVFAENVVDIDVLFDLTDADLEKLRIPLGDCKRMFKAIAAYQQRSTPQTNVPAATVASPHSEAERRHLTVMFCDLVGSTGLAVELDPEELSGVVRRFNDTCAAVIKHFGGCIGRFMGDGLLVYFGYPQAHEDDAERAVRAALDIVANVGQLRLPSGERLQVRVGIATGSVVVGETIGEGSAQEQAVFGETPNLAAHLQQLATPNSILVAATTHRLLGSAFVCADLGRVEVKGKSKPVAAWRIISESVVESRFDAMRPKQLTRFVGRQEQLSGLLNFWEHAKRGVGQVVLLCGEPGIGKSRISKALLDAIAEEPHVTVRYQCSPHHTNSPFFPVINQLVHAARFEREDSPNTKLDKLEAVLSQAGDASLADAPLFAALLSISVRCSLSRLEAHSPATERPHDRGAFPSASRPRLFPTSALAHRGRTLDRCVHSRSSFPRHCLDQDCARVFGDNFQARVLAPVAGPVARDDATAQSTAARAGRRHGQ